MSGLMTAKKAIERVREIQEKNEGSESMLKNFDYFWQKKPKKCQNRKTVFI